MTVVKTYIWITTPEVPRLVKMYYRLAKLRFSYCDRVISLNPC